MVANALALWVAKSPDAMLLISWKSAHFDSTSYRFNYVGHERLKQWQKIQVYALCSPKWSFLWIRCMTNFPSDFLNKCFYLFLIFPFFNFETMTHMSLKQCVVFVTDGNRRRYFNVISILWLLYCVIIVVKWRNESWWLTKICTPPCDTLHLIINAQTSVVLWFVDGISLSHSNFVGPVNSYH